MSFAAKYPGVCAYGDRIEPGDMCCYTDDEIAHVECDQLDGATNIHTETPCPDCNLVHAGRCDW